MRRRIRGQKRTHRVSTKPGRMGYAERKSTALPKAARWKEEKPMKLLPAFLAPLTAIAAASLVLCSTGFADTPPSATLTIENNQKLVTVKDGNGSWLFAQVMTTSNLQISQTSLGKNLSRISLQDSAGNTLWSKSLTCGITEVNLAGGWQDKFQAAGEAYKQGIKDLGAEAVAATPLYYHRYEFTIGPDDQLVSAIAVATKHTFKATPLKNGVAVTIDGKDLLVVLPQMATPVAIPASTPLAPAASN